MYDRKRRAPPALLDLDQQCQGVGRLRRGTVAALVHHRPRHRQRGLLPAGGPVHIRDLGFVARTGPLSDPDRREVGRGCRRQYTFSLATRIAALLAGSQFLKPAARPGLGELPERPPRGLDHHGRNAPGTPTRGRPPPRPRRPDQGADRRPDPGAGITHQELPPLGADRPGTVTTATVSPRTAAPSAAPAASARGRCSPAKGPLRAGCGPRSAALPGGHGRHEGPRRDATAYPHGVLVRAGPHRAHHGRRAMDGHACTGRGRYAGVWTAGKTYGM